MRSLFTHCVSVTSQKRLRTCQKRPTMWQKRPTMCQKRRTCTTCQKRDLKNETSLTYYRGKDLLCVKRPHKRDSLRFKRDLRCVKRDQLTGQKKKGLFLTHSRSETESRLWHGPRYAMVPGRSLLYKRDLPGTVSGPWPRIRPTIRQKRPAMSK